MYPARSHFNREGRSGAMLRDPLPSWCPAHVMAARIPHYQLVEVVQVSQCGFACNAISRERLHSRARWALDRDSNDKLFRNRRFRLLHKCHHLSSTILQIPTIFDNRPL